MFFTIVRIVMIILGIVGTTFLIPISAAISLGEYEVLSSFIIPMIFSWLVAVIFFFAGRKKQTRLSTRSAFIVVASAWASVSLFGALPLYFSGAIPNIVDAFFESVSGFSTTGSTILSDIESLPRSINLWRCQTHWLGGMGIVALTVALLPILGVGGFQLIKAETTGPEKGKFTPKITTTSKILWFIYFGFTVTQTILLCIFGMDFIDALSHAFSTLGTGGYSTKNSSVGGFNSVAIDIICTLFMFLSGINFTLYYYLFVKKIAEIKDNTEFKIYLIMIATATLLITIIEKGQYGGFFNSLRYSSFQAISIMSTTGFSTADFTAWHPASQAIIFILFFIGGCSGSTSGGVKVVRWIILSKQLHNELLKMLHPHGIFTIRLNNRAGRKDVVFSVAAFFFVWVMSIALTTFFTCCFGIDVFTSFTGALSMAGNIGPGFNLLGPSANFGWLPAAVKWWYCVLMIAGRLEFFTIIIFFSPSYWKK